jgi:hypothetical protein
MGKEHKLIAFLLLLSMTVIGGFCMAFADDDGHRERRRYHKRVRDHLKNNIQRDLPIVSEPAYTENCGACHFAYQPELLPSGSWEKILAGLSDHFGESIDLDPETEKTISDFMNSNSATYSSRKLSLKIMKSLGKRTPLRITEVPYIRREHHKIQNNVLTRESIGSLSNCTACHTCAENGVYDDDNVTIQRYK